MPNVILPSAGGGGTAGATAAAWDWTQGADALDLADYTAMGAGADAWTTEAIVGGGLVGVMPLNGECGWYRESVGAVDFVAVARLALGSQTIAMNANHAQSVAICFVETGTDAAVDIWVGGACAITSQDDSMSRRAEQGTTALNRWQGAVGTAGFRTGIPVDWVDIVISRVGTNITFYQSAGGALRFIHTYAAFSGAAGKIAIRGSNTAANCTVSVLSYRSAGISISNGRLDFT